MEESQRGEKILDLTPVSRKVYETEEDKFERLVPLLRHHFKDDDYDYYLTTCSFFANPAHAYLVKAVLSLSDEGEQIDLIKRHVN